MIPPVMVCSVKQGASPQRNTVMQSSSFKIYFQNPFEEILNELSLKLPTSVIFLKTKKKKLFIIQKKQKNQPN